MARNKTQTQPLIGWMFHYLWQIDEISWGTGHIIEHEIDANKLAEYCLNEINSGGMDLLDLADQHYDYACNSAFVLSDECVKDIVNALVINAAASIRFHYQNEDDLSLTYGMRVSELFGMFWSTVNLTRHVLKKSESLEELNASWSAKDRRSKRKIDKRIDYEKILVKAKYLQLTAREGKGPTGPRLAQIMAPHCKAISCNAEVLRRWIKQWRDANPT